VAYFELLSRNLPREAGENMKNLSQYSRCPGRDSNPVLPKHTPRDYR
jgi:hypothetical protein